VPITTIFFTILLLGLAALRRSQGSRTDDDIFDLLLGAVHPLYALHNKTVIDRSFKAAIDAGATSIKEPSLRPEWRADYFAANIGDPDGYNIEIAYKPWLYK